MDGPGFVGPRPAGFAHVLRQRAFAVPYAAETVSLLGDQLARVALSILVFRQTGSATATALTYAGTFLPGVVGGALLGHLGDRAPRRVVMVGLDLLRAALFAGMAVHGEPLWVIATLLVAAVFVGPGFSAAEVGYLAAHLDAESFRTGTGLRLFTNQLAQVAGFAVGGVTVVALTVRGALLIDAATFAVSALAVGVLLRGGGAPTRAIDDTVAEDRTPPADDGRSGSASGVRYLWNRPRLRAFVALGALAGFFVVPEGLAVPLAAELHVGAAQAGFLLAAVPLGAAVGAVTLVRGVPQRWRGTAAQWMAVGCGVPLVATAVATSWPVVFAAWAVSGLLGAYQVDTTTEIVRSIPDAWRSRVLALLSAALVGAQGVGLIVFGAVAQATGVRTAITLAGGTGCVAALVLLFGPLRSFSATDEPRDVTIVR